MMTKYLQEVGMELLVGLVITFFQSFLPKVILNFVTDSLETNSPSVFEASDVS